MAIESMTGFAREAGAAGAWRFAWEIRSVNSKALDLRLRLPPAVEDLGEEVRRRLGAAVKRGAVTVNLALQREAGSLGLRINEALLDALIVLARRHAADGIAPPSLDGLLAVRGVVDVTEEVEDEAAAAALRAALIAALDRTVAALAAARRGEGAALAAVLGARLDEIERLTRAADGSPARTPEAIREKLAAQVAALIGTGHPLDPARLHQEAVLLAAKADIREEIDRLLAHVAQARALVAEGGAIGRRLDFLSQELGREANTLCAKSADIALTAIGLDLKTVVEQFREQVQNVA